MTNDEVTRAKLGEAFDRAAALTESEIEDLVGIAMKAVLEERESCADVASRAANRWEGMRGPGSAKYWMGKTIAVVIRARGEERRG